MNIAGSTTWEDMQTTEVGTGSVSVSGNVASFEVTSGGAGNAAYKVRRYHTAPGEIYEMTAMARRVSGVNGSSGRLFIDWPAGASIKNEAEITSEDWQEYSVSFAVPLNSDANDFIQFGIGLYTGQEGKIEVAHPRVTVHHTPFGAPRSVGHALFEWDGSSITVNANFTQFNIKDVEYDDTDKAVYVTVEQINNTSQYLRPLMFGQITPDGSADVIKLVPKVGNYDISTGKVKVQFMDVTSGVYVDITNLSPMYFSLFCFI